MKTSVWFKRTHLGEWCTSDTHCKNCERNGNCDPCNTIDGRCIENVSDYASTCDWCGELTHHDNLAMDPVTQLGYCGECVPKLPKAVQKRLPKD